MVCFSLFWIGEEGRRRGWTRVDAVVVGSMTVVVKKGSCHRYSRRVSSWHHRSFL
jgi:hypothetical protein